MGKKEDDSVGMSLGWSNGRITGKIKSRWLSSLDWFGSRKVDAAGLDVDRKVAVHQAITEAQLAIIAAATKSISAEIKNDPELARRALLAFGTAERKASNVEACLQLTLEDLSGGGDAAEPDSGPDELNPDILARWQMYAEGATSEVVRERWAKTLAAEVRRPGTFSMKILRIIDELDQETAHAFEALASLRFGTWIPKIAIEIDKECVGLLGEAGLISQSELGHTVSSTLAKHQDGSDWWVVAGDAGGVAVSKDAKLPGVDREHLSFAPIRIDRDILKLGVVALTNAGMALASIMPHDEFGAGRQLVRAIRKFGTAEEVRQLVRLPDGALVDAEGDNQPTFVRSSNSVSAAN